MPRPKKFDYSDKIERARIQLLTNHPFFGRVATYLGWEHSPDIPIAATDGERVIFGHALLDICTNDELVFIAAHEVHHVIKRHHFRIKDRDHLKWNIATDFQINDELIKCGLAPPTSFPPLLDKQYTKDMLEEEIYNKIPDPPPGLSIWGEVLPSPHPEGSPEQQAAETGLNKAIECAAQVAKARGKLPGCLERYSAEIKQPKVNWKERMNQFLQPLIPRDISWQTPNRRMLQNGWIPGPFKEGVGEVCIAFDTSGSISVQEINLFASEVMSICADACPSKVVIYYFHSNIWRKDEFESCVDFTPPDKIERGGTYLTPVLEDIEKENKKPVCLVIFSDLYIESNIKEPDYPVLAVSTTELKLPFGETINVKL